MCGKYHVSTEEENIEMRDYLAKALASQSPIAVRSGDIVPSLASPIITSDTVEPMVFGIKLSSVQRLVINARSETAHQSPLYAPMLEETRCMVPVTAFYEWNKEKKPFLFYPEGAKNMFLAGLYKLQESIPRFVILTRPANETVATVHHRMPLILPNAEFRDAWLQSAQLAREILSIPQDIPLDMWRASA